jgi:ABC-type antimicrobial peptide transport system permease subunit
MTSLRLIFCNLIYFRAASIAVVAGMAVATAVLAGSLMVGDSVRGSLEKLAVQRLGPVDYALVANRFFDDSKGQGLATRLSQSPGIAAEYEIAPAVIANGSASTGSGATAARTGDVQILGVGGEWAKVARGKTIINDETAAALGIREPGVSISFKLPSKQETPREATIARRAVSDLSYNLSATAESIAGEPGMLSLFSLAGGQRKPRNAWVNLAELQEVAQQPGRANVVLVHDRAAPAFHNAEQMQQRSQQAIDRLNNAIKQVVSLDDYGLMVHSSDATGERFVAARGTYLDPPVVTAAVPAGRSLGVEPRLVTVNLVNRVVVTDENGNATDDAPTLHYIISAGITHLNDAQDVMPPATTGPASSPVGFGPKDIVLNEETARPLRVKVGDHIRLDYFRRESDGRLVETSSVQQGIVFRVSRVIAMKGIGADDALTPQYKGITHDDQGRRIKSVSGWNAPAELGLNDPKNKELAKRDNDPYFNKYLNAPRLFISMETAGKLWGGPYGEVTSVRVPGDKGDAFAAALRSSIDPKSLGFVFQPIKLQQLAASTGSTDFSGLFVGFSFFLIAAAVLLVAMLFRLNIEQRVRQFGVLSAVGFAPRRVRWLALREGMLLAIIGGVIGCAVGVGYTWLMVYGLRTWWVGAIGTTALELHVRPMTLGIGFAAGVLVAMAAVLWAVWRLGRVTPARLMAGELSAIPRGKRRDGRIIRLIGAALALVGIAILAMVFSHAIKQPEMALAGGAVLLAAGLTYLAGVLRPRRHAAGHGDISTIAAIGLRNANRHTARSVLSIGLIAFAAFTLITVASMQKTDVGDTGDPKGGAGGYRLIVQAAVPVLADLNTAAGRSAAGFDAGEENAGTFSDWQSVKFMQLRRWAGQDISCLNLTRPTSPTILGVPHAMVQRNAFTFAETSDRADNPLTLIEKPPASGGAIPVFTDHETAAYILKLGIGDKLSITDQLGRPRELQLVGTLAHSVFQSEMLMSEANFRELFPAQSGFGTILLECPADKVEVVQRALNEKLEPYAVSIDTTAARLASYQEIQNTYLSTFRALGSLGLALGTIGLAVVLIRNVIERRGELALLAALGFLSRDRVKIVLSENILLLVLGLSVGTVCAVLGIVPTLLGSRTGINWMSLGLTLAGVLALGVLASIAAVWVSGVRVTPRDLRRE